MLGKLLLIVVLLLLTCIPDLGKTEMVKCVWAAKALSALCTSQEGLHHSIDTIHAHLKTYNLEVWLILHEWDTCVASVRELEEVLAEDEEMVREKVQYDAKRAMLEDGCGGGGG